MISFYRFLTLLALLCWAALPVAIVRAADASATRVLFINSYHRGYAWSDDIEAGLREKLLESGRNIELSYEYLDSRRFTYGEQIEPLAQAMVIKYANYRPRLVVVSDNAAFDFAIRYRPRLFPGVPIVFTGYNSFRPEVLHGIDDVTGVNEEIAIEDAVALALRVHPRTRTLAFILSTGDRSTRRNAEVAEQTVFPRLRERFEVVEMKDASAEEVRQRLSTLPRETLLFLVGQVRDRPEGRGLTPIESARLIVPFSPFPVYTFWDFHLGLGVIGGHIVSGRQQGLAAGELALKVLAGTPAGSIPVIMTTPTEDIFDYAVMQRFGIRPEDLPAGARIINRPFSVWEHYRGTIIGTLVLLALQTVLIVFLLRNIRARRQAVAALDQERAQLEVRVAERTREAREAQQAAETANRAKSEFLSSMSHELRTPLNAVIGFTQLLTMDERLAAEQRENLREIAKAGQQLLELINEVLDLARIEAGRVELSMEGLSVRDLAQECVQRIAPLAARRGIVIAVELAEDLTVFADRNRLRQVLLNLLSNAIKYNVEGGQVRLTAHVAENGRVRIAVRDTGPGIAAEKLPLLFQPFNRLGQEAGNIEGTGIGLTITRRLVELMGGTVGVDSTPGEGSTFWVELAAATETKVSADGTASGETPPAAISDAGARLLAIDDNPTNLKLLARMIGRIGPQLKLTTAHNAEFGLELARAQPPDLILLDIGMPGMNGLELLAIMKADERLQNIPVIAITAHAMPHDIERGRAAGFADYLTKPLDFDTLRASLIRHLPTAKESA